MATSDYFSEADLKNIMGGNANNDGWVNEDLMQQVWDISRIPLPLQDALGSGVAEQSFTEWTEDKLAAPDLDNAQVDGRDSTGNDARAGERIGNHCQISTKDVIVTSRAQASDTIGGNQLSYQVMMRQRELRRDQEAIMLSNQGSQADDGDTVPGKAAGLGACITQGDRTGTGGGFANNQWAAYVPGTKRALTETLVRDVAQEVWEQGGDPSILMSVPKVMRELSNYMFTESARIATLTAETNQQSPATAVGAVSVFATDFGVVLSMVPNRLQQAYQSAGGAAGDAASLFVLDPNYAEEGVLRGARVEPLGKKGLSDARLMSKDWTLKVLNRDAHGVIADIDLSLPVTQV